MYLIDTYISTPDKPSMGGAEKQLYLLVSSLNPVYFKPIVVQLSPNNSRPLNDVKVGNAELFHIPISKFYSLHGFRQIGRLSRLVKQYNVDIIHTFFEKSEVMGWLTARLSGIPIWITSRRDLGFKRKKIYDQIFRLTSKDCKKCIANCYAVKDQVVQQNNLATKKVQVIYNGLELFGYQEPFGDKSVRRKLGIENDTLLVGMIANFNFEIKGHGYFLEAAKKITETVPNVKFLLVGDGPLRHQYEEMASDLDVKKDVLFLGKRNDVPAIISNLDVSVQSSTSEGLSNVILESMAAGKPVIATNIGGNPEMVVNDITGYLVPPADSGAMAGAITALLQEPDKAKAMGAAGKRLVEEKFSKKAMVKKYENLYKSLMGDSKCLS